MRSYSRMPETEKLARDFRWGVCVMFIVWLLANATGPWTWIQALDDTDLPTKRSGMNLYTDHGTGCQYLATPLGSLTPRLDADGKPICGGEQ